jgi:undecaprenyl pyrophosphate phosphatase UppP
LLSVYFAPVWGIDAIRALVSPFSGLEDRAHAAAAIYVGRFFDLQLDGLMRTANVLAGVKLVIAAGFLAYVIEFARALAVGREVDRETLDIVLIAAAGAIIVWALPTLAFEDAGLTRLHATQLALVAGAAVMIVIERQIEQSARATTSAREPEAVRQAPTQSQGLAA